MLWMICSKSHYQSVTNLVSFRTKKKSTVGKKSRATKTDYMINGEWLLMGTSKMNDFFGDEDTMSDQQRAWRSVLCRTSLNGLIFSAAKCADIAQNGNMQIMDSLNTIIQVQLHRIQESGMGQDEDIDLKETESTECADDGPFECLTFKVNQSVEKYQKFAEDHGVKISESDKSVKKKVIKGQCQDHRHWVSDETLKEELKQYLSHNERRDRWDDDANAKLDKWGGVTQKGGMFVSAHPAMRGEYFMMKILCRKRLRRTLVGTKDYDGGIRCDSECGYECYRCKKQWTVLGVKGRVSHQGRCRKAMKINK